MKYLSKILAVLLFAVPVLAWSNGIHTPGTVQVTTNHIWMTGAYNVRHNPAVSQGSIGVSINPGEVFSISAKDSNTGTAFGCIYSIYHASPYQYWVWEQALSRLTNGSVITAIRTSIDDNTCQSISIVSGSNNLD